ncbi:MAG: NADH-quinone oxidoreductase subunit J [Ktedonobacteraceae bacterium]
MNGVIEWIIFLFLSAIAVAAAASMILTMSMYRAGLALMASFVALAGLFILLQADLLAAIQVMMNVGGMLVMVLFMVMMMMDPGGEMMWGMKRDMHIPGPAAFSMTMPRDQPPEEDIAGDKEQQATSPMTEWTCPMHPEIHQGSAGTCPKCDMTLIPRAEMADGDAPQAPASHVYTCPMHPEIQQDQPGTCPKCGMNLVLATDSMQEQSSDEQHTLSMSMEHASNDDSAHSPAQEMSMPAMAMGKRNGHAMQMAGGTMDNHAGMTPRQYYDMMVGMAMSTAQLPSAILLGAIAALLLIILVIQTPWTLAPGGPTQDATTMVGDLLLSRYMIGFEGAAFLILAGIAGAVILGQREGTPAEQPSMRPTEVGEKDEQASTCPMHPEVKQDQPGTCPKCGMTLIPSKETLMPGETGKQGEHI